MRKKLNACDIVYFVQTVYLKKKLPLFAAPEVL